MRCPPPSAYEANKSTVTNNFHHRPPTPANDYDYDDLDRLTDVEYLSNQLDVEGFVMDNLGSRTGNQTLRSDGTVNFTVQSSTNRYTSIGGHSITHDDAGNLTVDKDGYKYFYDYENRVVKIQKPDGLGGWDDVAQMAYDALGRRIRVIDSVASMTTLYYYNPEWQCLVEYNGAGTLQRYFVYGNYIDEPLVMNDGTDDFYYVQDHLYSTVALLAYDDQQTAWDVVERYEYDAYGTVLVYTDDGGDDDWFDGDETTAIASAKGNPYTFTGRRLDTLDSGGLVRMHYRHRDYNVYTGRFLQYDPLGLNPANSLQQAMAVHDQYMDGLNLLTYTNNPVNLCDAYGTSAGHVIGPVIIAAAACAAPHVAWWHLIADSNNDKYAHCVISCRIAKSCGRLLSLAAGHTKELRDEIAQRIGKDDIGWDPADIEANAAGRSCAGWISWLPNGITWGIQCFRKSCNECCAEKGYGK